jgi:alkylation response protein AidB-like acyl-CoA dehydrogenase
MFRDLCGDEHIKQLYRQPLPLHKELWQQLAASGMLGTPLPAQLGGSEMGMTELCLVLQSQGTHVAPLPLLETIVECAMPIAQFAAEKLSQELIPKVISGDFILSPVRPYQGLQEHTPLSAQAEDEMWILNGYSSVSGYASHANGFLVAAHLDNGRHWVGYCPADAPGIEVVAQRATNGEGSGHIQFSNVKVNPEHCIAINDEADVLLQWQSQRTFAAMAALQIGVLTDGLRRAAEYTRERTQFNRSLASFQSVAQQMADGYMAIEAYSR